MVKRTAFLIGGLFLVLGFVLLTNRPSFSYPDLPFDSVSKHTVVSSLKEMPDGQIKRLTIDARYTWYGAKTAQGKEMEKLITAMGEKGWSYLQQEGSGYFFVRGNETIVITSRKWSGEFTLFQVPLHSVTLPDSF